MRSERLADYPEVDEEILREVPEEYLPAESVEVTQSTKKKLVDELRSNPLRLISLFVVVGFVIMAVFAPVIAPHDPGRSFGLLQSPNSVSEGDFNYDGEEESAWHALGTDSNGYDILTRIIFGTRISLLVGLSTMVIALVIGCTIGLVAGFYGGWIDNLLMRYVDFQFAFPTIILAVGIIAFVGGLGLMNVIIAIAVAYIDDFARIVRGEVLWIREKEYVSAARTMGMGDLRLMTSEILPNAIAPIIVQATIMIPLAILAEAGLSFIGLGVTPDTPTWGLLISDGRGYITSAWWVSIMPGIAIVLCVLAFNILGDGLRDAFDVTEVE